MFLNFIYKKLEEGLDIFYISLLTNSSLKITAWLEIQTVKKCESYVEKKFKLLYVLQVSSRWLP